MPTQVCSGVLAEAEDHAELERLRVTIVPLRAYVETMAARPCAFTFLRCPHTERRDCDSCRARAALAAASLKENDMGAALLARLRALEAFVEAFDSVPLYSTMPSKALEAREKLRAVEAGAATKGEG